MTAHEHNRTAGILLMVHGGLSALMMIAVCVIYAVMGTVMFTQGRGGEEQMIGAVFIGLIAFMGIFGAIVTIPQLIGGYKLIKQRPNARTWGIVGSIVALLSFPLGTAAGVYALWFLFGDGGKEVYLSGQNQRLFQHPPEPPAPNSWQ
ncbi:MAG: hypothetical protein WKF34_03700 [Pyrinomonadaceae bacterium]